MKFTPVMAGVAFGIAIVAGDWFVGSVRARAFVSGLSAMVRHDSAILLRLRASMTSQVSQAQIKARGTGGRPLHRVAFICVQHGRTRLEYQHDLGVALKSASGAYSLK